MESDERLIRRMVYLMTSWDSRAKSSKTFPTVVPNIDVNFAMGLTLDNPSIMSVNTLSLTSGETQEPSLQAGELLSTVNLIKLI